MRHFLPALACLCLLTSCYHVGAPGNARFTLNELKVQNGTREPSLGRCVSSAIREHIGTDPAASLARKGEATQYDIFVDVTECNNSQLASARLRERKDRDHNSSAYQSVLFRITLKAKIKVMVPGTDQPVLDRVYTGQGDLPLMNDREAVFQNACRQAANSIALQLVDDVATLK